MDYRRLNAVTIKDAYPIQRINESLDTLSRAKWFSIFEIGVGLLAGRVRQRSQTNVCVRGPWGLVLLASERVLAGLHWDILLVYLDDVRVFAKTVEEELVRLETVFQRLREAGLKPENFTFLGGACCTWGT